MLDRTSRVILPNPSAAAPGCRADLARGAARIAARLVSAESDLRAMPDAEPAVFGASSRPDIESSDVLVNDHWLNLEVA